MSQRKYTFEQISTMAEEYAAGATHRELAARYGGTDITVGRTLSRHGVHARTPEESKALRTPQSGIVDDELRRLYVDEGWNVAPLAQHFHVRNQAVTARLRELGIPVRSGGRVRRHFVTDESCQALAEEYREVGNVHVLAERHGVSAPTISAALRRAGQQSTAKGREGEFSPAKLTGGVVYGPTWPVARDARMQLDDFRCLACGHPRSDKTRRLTVAHLIPADLFAADDQQRRDHADNLRTLCRACHSGFDQSPHTGWDRERGDRPF